MPALTKQTLINLLIDSPLREPIKINLIDIVNNTNDVDLPKTYSTISKELEIFQKATERRMKLADETISKLKGESGVPTTPHNQAGSPQVNDSLATLPPLPPLPPMPTPTPAPTLQPLDTPATPSLSVPPLDLPPLPTSNPEPAAPADLPPLEPAPAADADEDALKEIQKELDALKSSAAEDLPAQAGATPSPTPTI